jgi:hypothetical protein
LRWEESWAKNEENAANFLHEQKPNSPTRYQYQKVTAGPLNCNEKMSPQNPPRQRLTGAVPTGSS